MSRGILLRVRPYWPDLLIITLLTVVGAVVSYRGAQTIDPLLLTPYAQNTWFESDIDRVYANMVSRLSDHHRTNAHPLFPIIAHPAVFVVERALGVGPAVAIRLVIAAVAALWASAQFVLLRLLGCRRLDAFLLSGVAGASSAAIFWFAVPETYSFGSLTILLALILVAVAERRPLSDWRYVGVSALTLSITVTNWMSGLLATLVSRPWRRALQISVNAFAAVTLLWGLQKFVYPSAVFFIGDTEERSYLFTPEPRHVLNVARSFAFHTVVMPTIEVRQFRQKRPMREGMIVQQSPPGSAGAWGAVAAGAWGALLGLGLWALVSLKQHAKLRLVLAGMLVGQLALHLVYGGETFLYALNFAPLLVTVAALSTLTRARPVALALAALLVVTSAVNNVARLRDAAAFYEARRNDGGAETPLPPVHP